MYKRRLKRDATAPLSALLLSRTWQPASASESDMHRVAIAEQTAAKLKFLLLPLWLMTPALLLLLGSYSHLDLFLADRMFDPVSGQFPWRHAWLTEKFGHHILKALLIVWGGSIVVACLWDLARPVSRWNGWFRLRLRVIAASAIAIPSIIGALKSVSAPHCPWDLQRYGGVQPYYRLLETLQHGVTPGHCFPAGHASSALWLTAIAVFWWPHRPRTAAIVGSTMLLIGFAVGWLQQMRGAHFLSHTLWSIWIACTVIIAVFIGLNARESSRRFRKLNE